MVTFRSVPFDGFAFYPKPGYNVSADDLIGSQGSSSIGRAPVSKTGGCGFDSCLPCQTALNSGYRMAQTQVYWATAGELVSKLARGKSGLALSAQGKKVGAQRKLWQGDLTAANLSLWDSSSRKSSTETSCRGNMADETRKAPSASNANYGSGTPQRARATSSLSR